MGIIREPDGVDFVICSKPLTKRDAAMISAWIRKDRQQREKARAAREKLETKALALPCGERSQLAYQLLSSLVTEGTDESQRAWASAAKTDFEQLHAIRLPTKANKKPTRRTKSARV